MQRKHWTILSFSFVAIAAVVHAAGCRTNGCNVDPDCDTESSGNGGGPPVTPSSCIPKTNQEASQTAVKDECGIFVRLAGDDAAAGTKSKPVRTIAHAVEVAMAAKEHRVYVCAEIFSETLELHSGIEIYGGLNCAGGAWSYSGKRTSVAPEADKIPLRFIKDSDAKIHLEDVDARAADSAVPSGSSIAATADAVTLELLRSELIAGSGAPGDKGAMPTGNVLPESPDDPQIAGVQGTQACMGGASGNGGPSGAVNPFCVTTTGGKGGNGQETAGDKGGDGQPLPNPNPMNFGLGGTGSMGAGCTAGQKGGKGTDGTAGISASDAATMGSFDLGGYIGVDGKAGGDGAPGQGGGGGGGAKGKSGCFGATGGSGGAGGCGGKGGTGGKAGGSSIALISIGATLLFQEVKLTAGSGGNGGDGGDGQLGGIGGTAGKGGTPAAGTSGGCTGGDGGEGGAGGKGGGGHGGHAIGIVYSGDPPPEFPAGTITFGNPGNGGAGSAGDAALGLAQPTFALP